MKRSSKEVSFARMHVFVALVSVFMTLSACANDHFFPRLRPLFVGLDQAKVPASARTALEQAKTDFQLARRGQLPQYAHYVETLPHSHSRVFEGNGYRLTLVKTDTPHVWEQGPEIVLSSKITGGKPCRYDEIDRLGE